MEMHNAIFGNFHLGSGRSCFPPYEEIPTANLYCFKIKHQAEKKKTKYVIPTKAEINCLVIERGN